MKQRGNPEGGQRGQQAGDQRRVIQKAYADNRHGEDRRRQGRTEQRREEGRHPGERCGAQITVIQVQKLAGFITDGPAHLQRGAFTARGTAAEMRQQRGEKDGRNEVELQALSGLDFADDVVGALAFHGEEGINRHDGGAGQREQPDEPAMCLTERRGHVDADVKRGAQQTAEDPDDAGDQHPLGQRPDIDGDTPALQTENITDMSHENCLSIRIQQRKQLDYMRAKGKTQAEKTARSRTVSAALPGVRFCALLQEKKKEWTNGIPLRIIKNWIKRELSVPSERQMPREHGKQDKIIQHGRVRTNGTSGL